MKYSAKVNVKGKTYSIAFTPATGAVYCVNCGTLRTITAAKTLATIYAAWAAQDHAEALEADENVNQTAIFLSSKEFRGQWPLIKPYQLLISISACHAKALGIDAARSKRTAFEENYTKTKQYNEFDASEVAEALEIDEVINTAVDVIKAMAGHDIETVLAGVRSMMHHYGVITEVCAAAYTALRVAVEDSHTEALELNKAHSL